MKFRTAYGPKIQVAEQFPDPGLTEQQWKDSCDINNIVARYVKDGIVDHVNKYEGRFGDATGKDYTEAMRRIADANSMFAELPSKVRLEFEQSPAKFLDFLAETDPSEVSKTLMEMSGIELPPDPRKGSEEASEEPQTSSNELNQEESAED